MCGLYFIIAVYLHRVKGCDYFGPLSIKVLDGKNKSVNDVHLLWEYLRSEQSCDSFFLLPSLPPSLLFDLVPEEEVAQKVCVYLRKPHSFSPHSSPMLLIWLKEQCKVILYCNVIFTKNLVNQIRRFDLIQYIPFRLSVCHLIMLYWIVLVQ